MKKLEICRFGAQILGTCTVQMVVGGVITAIMPPEVSVVYKAVTKVGAYIAAGVITKALDDSVNKTFDDLDEIVDTINECRKVLQQKEPEQKPASEETSEEEDGE